MQTDPFSSASQIGRWMVAIVGFIFCGIGLTLLGFFWLSSIADFIPLFFRIFASFIAVGFVAFGGGTALMSLLGQIGSSPIVTASALLAATPGSYKCTQCGAPLADKSSVSPLGDVKCSFCNAWFNIHQQRAS
jgi:hypothetical protein